MRKIITALFLILFTASLQTAYADNVIPTASASAIKASPASSDYSRSYKTSSENLLYLLLAAINEHNYSIEEIQFKTGSVLFKAYQKEFLASIASKDGYNSFIKIIPTDNNYNFSPLLLQKLHNYLENNTGISFQKII